MNIVALRATRQRLEVIKQFDDFEIVINITMQMRHFFAQSGHKFHDHNKVHDHVS